MVKVGRLGCRVPTWHKDPPLLTDNDRQTRLKNILPATSLVGGNNVKIPWLEYEKCNIKISFGYMYHQRAYLSFCIVFSRELL